MKPDSARVWIGPVARHEPGGAARYIQALMGHSAHTLLSSKETPEMLWALRFIGRRFRLFKSAYARYQYWIRHVDVAHIHRSPLYTEPFQAMEGRIPWIFTLHGIGFEEHRKESPDDYRWMRAYRDSVLQVMENASLATVVSRWLRDWVEERTAASVVVTPPGVDLLEFQQVPPSEFIEWSGVPEGFVLWVGRLSEEKQVDLFIDLASRLEDLHFVVMANSAERQFRALHGGRLPPNLHYIGMAPRRYVVSAFQGCSVHVNTSLYDAAPTTLIEAMACGKPVVAPDHTGPQEIIGDSGGGFLFDPRSVKSLEEQVLRALDNPQVGRKGFDFVREHRDWRVLVKYFDRQYAALGGGGNS